MIVRCFVLVFLALSLLPMDSHANDTKFEHRKNITYIKSYINTKCNQSSKCHLISADVRGNHIFISIKDGGDSFRNNIILSDVAVALNRMNKMAIKEGLFKVARWSDVTLNVGETKFYFDKSLFVKYKNGQINDAQFAKLARNN